MGVTAGQFLPVPMKLYLFAVSVGALVGSFTGIMFEDVAGDGVGGVIVCRGR